MYAKIETTGIDVKLSINGRDVFVIDSKKSAANQGITLTDADFLPYRGVISIRFSLYLEPDDPRYNEHYVEVADETSDEFKKGYQGKRNGGGFPVDQKDFDQWAKSLPTIWQNNPFHNHFDDVSVDITDAALLQLMNKRLVDFGAAWAAGHKPLPTEPKNEALIQIMRGWDRNDTHNKSKATYERCGIKALDIATRVASFRVAK